MKTSQKNNTKCIKFRKLGGNVCVNIAEGQKN